MRLFLIGLGFVSLLAGAIGIVLPLLPTTPFLLVAAWAFARSSPRLHDRLLEDPRFGPIITQWRSHGVIRPRAKLAAVAALVATCGLSLLLGVSGGVLAIQLTVLSAVGVFVISRPGSAAASEAWRSRAGPGVR
jgi:uncharacterized protein